MSWTVEVERKPMSDLVSIVMRRHDEEATLTLELSYNTAIQVAKTIERVAYSRITDGRSDRVRGIDLMVGMSVGTSE